MNNLNYGENVVYFLRDLAANEVDDITSGEFDVYGEDDQGREGCAVIDMTLLAADAVSMITSLQEQVQKLAAENSTVRVMNDVLSEELRGYESDGAYEGPNMHKLWYSNADMPATDAVIREIGAKAVDGFGIYHNFSDKLFIQQEAQKYAAQLRAGDV